MEIAQSIHLMQKTNFMKKSIFVSCLFLCVELLAQTEKPTESKINSVTVFLSKAQVTRSVKTKVEAGKTILVFDGLSPQLDPQSIQVGGKGKFTIMGTGHRINYLSEFNKPKKLAVLQDSLQLLQKAIVNEGSQKEVLNREEQMILANQKISGTNQNLTVLELKSMADFFRSRLGELTQSKIKVDEKIKLLNEKSAKIQKQITEQRDVFNRNTSEILVTIQADAATAVELDLSYVVANAGWAPVYDLRAVDTKSPMQLAYKASVFQSTGEEWNNVHIVLSTANPNLGGLKPELAAWYLEFYQPIVRNERNEGARVKRSAPAAMRSSAASGDDLKAEADIEEATDLSDFVTTVETSLNVEFDISIAQTVLSSAKPTVVDVRSTSVNANYEYAVAPKLDLDAFLLAKITGWEDLNLLPGDANIFFEGTFVGKTFIDPNNIRDTLSVSMGRDKRIVIKREKVKGLSSRNVIGVNERQTSAWEISVRNTKSEPVKIVVEDQIPISRNNQIEVTVLDNGGGKQNTYTGKITWDLNLKPSENKKLSYKFEVKYPKDRRINGL
jgi:uncharacterized protein (TIGR02231 family)